MTTTSKPYLKETRNLSDKNCVLEMMKNVAIFLNDVGFPECITHKEIQKIDKQSFVKYFNVISFNIFGCKENVKNFSYSLFTSSSIITTSWHPVSTKMS